jgi:hypothetical protein
MILAKRIFHCLRFGDENRDGGRAATTETNDRKGTTKTNAAAERTDARTKRARRGSRLTARQHYTIG